MNTHMNTRMNTHRWPSPTYRPNPHLQRVPGEASTDALISQNRLDQTLTQPEPSLFFKRRSSNPQVDSTPPEPHQHLLPSRARSLTADAVVEAVEYVLLAS